MKFFIDSAEVDEIKSLYEMGMVDGVTTNPSLIAKSGRDFYTVIKEICSIVPGPVSAEVISTEVDEMIKEGLTLSNLAKNVVIKLPLTWNGLKACKALSEEGIQVNLTLCFSATQAILGAKAGATFISPFVGRLDDIGENGLGLIAEICEIYKNYNNFKTEVLVASIRNPAHIAESARIGAHIATIPPTIFKQLVSHPLTDKGLAIFLEDWKKVNK
jgi:transaldolase